MTNQKLLQRMELGSQQAVSTARHESAVVRQSVVGVPLETNLKRSLLRGSLKNANNTSWQPRIAVQVR